MKILEKPIKRTNFICPICGTSEIKPVILAGVSGTEDDKKERMEAIQIHVDCINPIVFFDEEEKAGVLMHAGEIKQFDKKK